MSDLLPPPQSYWCDWDGGYLMDGLALVTCEKLLNHEGEHEPILLFTSAADFGRLPEEET